MIELDQKWDHNKRRDETELLESLTKTAALDSAARERIVERAARLVQQIRTASRPGLMDVFLAEYGLSTDEGVALMCLAEALLRVPDASTIDSLIEDKIAASDWSRHVGQSSSPLVNASTWGLLLS
ncbi:MAG TPA: bifunctional proline dehydrogenase/L-glutamate gamma-semialdehyde dehydrogenase, partial [Marivita sp.]|nr:bifunctional proline dehydrogenase/L-glutamate gamma-semialdehyde dehydrogenase [Marivita sp.]